MAFCASVLICCVWVCATIVAVSEYGHGAGLVLWIEIAGVLRCFLLILDMVDQ